MKHAYVIPLPTFRWSRGPWSIQSLVSRTLIGLLGLALMAWLAWMATSELRNPSLGLSSAPSGSRSSPKSDPPSSGTEALAAAALGFQLPKGYSVTTYAKNLGGPRQLLWGPDGLLLTSIPGKRKVVALEDRNGDGVAEKTYTVVSGLSGPHGLALRCKDGPCTLYVAQNNRLDAFNYDSKTHRATNRKKLVDLPTGGRHTTRSVLYVPETDQLLVSIGSSCDVCNESDERRAKVYSINPDGSGFQEYSRGLRNSVFMALNPATGAVWATEMGRDFLGDDLPPDEINILSQGKNYGWPTCYGQNVHDTDFDKNTYIRNPCEEPFETPSKIDIPAHSAPLGLAFFPSKGWPQEDQGSLLVAYHGSWNRSVPTGYKVVRYRLDKDGNALAAEDFMIGFVDPKGKVAGRPVDLLVRPNGTLFVSDDKAGAVYQVVSNGNSTPNGNPPSKPTACVVSGCSGEICSDTNKASICIYRPEYQCYKKYGACESQSNGQCGWTPTDDLKQCIDSNKGKTNSVVY